MIKAIIFDFYGTLVNELEGYRHFSKLFLKNYNKEFSEEFIHRWFLKQREIIFKHNYKPFKEVMRESLQNTSKDLTTEVTNSDFENKIKTVFKNIEPFPETLGILNKLKTKFIVGILSNSDNDILELVLDKLNFKFDLILSAENLGSYKPDKGNYQSIINSLNLKINEILYVSSSLWDVKAARNFGFQVIFVNRKNKNIKTLDEQPELTINNLNKIIPIVNGFSKK